MFKYKNVTKGVLEFRTHRIDGVKTSFRLKPNEEVELYRKNLKIDGLETEKVRKGKSNKIKESDE